jgi:hypothetical protein
MRMIIRCRSFVALVALGLLGPAAQARTVEAGASPVAVVPGTDWRSLAQPRDRARLDSLTDAWAEALESVRGGGHAPAVAAAGALLDSRPAGDGAQPIAGNYRCRSLRLGTTDPDASAFIAYPAFRCRVRIEGGVTIFEKLNGSQRTAGVILPGTPVRSVLIGTEAMGNESGYPAYGSNAERDRIAAVERVGPDRWRLVFPRPSNGAIVEVMELVATR